MILIILVLIPTILITLQTIKKLEKFNNLISRILPFFIRVLVPVIIVYGVYHLISNWGNYDQKDIKESIIIIIGAAILTGLFEKLVRNIEKENHIKEDKQ